MKIKKNKFESEKIKILSEVNLEVASKLFSLLFKIGMSTGALLLVVYCGRIGFYPVGVDIGDGLLLIVIALCFGFIYTLLVIFLGSAAAVLSSLIKLFVEKIENYFKGWFIIQIEKPLIKDLISKIKPKSKWFSAKIDELISNSDKKSKQIKLFELTADHLPLWFIGITALFFLAVNAVYNWKTSLTLLAAAVVMMLCLTGLFPKSYPRSYKWPTLRTTFLLIFYFSPLFFGGVFGYILNDSFELAGIRLEKVSLYLDKDFHRDIIVGESGSEYKLEGKYIKIDNAMVLFTGAGTSSFVRIIEGENEGRLFIIPNNIFHIEIKQK